MTGPVSGGKSGLGISSHIEPKVLAARARSTSSGSTPASNTVSTSRRLRGRRRQHRKTNCPGAEDGTVLLLISGASGAGKTSVRQAITPDLGPAFEAVELRHLDTVPAVPDIAWRQRMAERAVVRAKLLDDDGRHLLLAGDPVAPGEVLAAPSASAVDIAICLLDVTEEAQRDRLRRRGDPEELLPSHVAFAEWLRHHAGDPSHMPHVLSTGGWSAMRWSRLSEMPREQWRMTVIDGSVDGVAEPGRAVLQWIRDAIAGRAPVSRHSDAEPDAELDR